MRKRRKEPEREKEKEAERQREGEALTFSPAETRQDLGRLDLGKTTSCTLPPHFDELPGC